VTTAFVLSGGGSLGAVQVGMLTALAERDVHPDLLVGTSAGAINAAYVAGHGLGRDALDDLAALWSGLRRRSLFHLSAARGVLAAFGSRESLCPAEPLARLLADQVPFRRLEAAPIPLHVVATDVLDGREVLLSTGDSLSALLASCAIPGIYPSVRRDGRVLCDGALANNSAISQAVALGADTIYLLPSGTACALDQAPTSPLGSALHAVTLLLEQRAILETRAYAHAAQLHVMPPLCPLRVAPMDFSQAAELVRRARRSTGRWLDEGSDELPYPERFLSLHDHRAADRPLPRVPPATSPLAVDGAS
jgi:NTE family protein